MDYPLPPSTRIAVAGAPGTGKHRLATALAQACQLPLVTAIGQHLMDSTGFDWRTVVSEEQIRPLELFESAILMHHLFQTAVQPRFVANQSIYDSAAHCRLHLRHIEAFAPGQAAEFAALYADLLDQEPRYDLVIFLRLDPAALQTGNGPAAPDAAFLDAELARLLLGTPRGGLPPCLCLAAGDRLLLPAGPFPV